MRGYRKRPGTQGFSVPLVGASLFFIISLFLFVSYKNSAYQQAKKEIYSLYTATRAFDLDEVYQDGLTAIYAKEYGKTATEAGCEALEQTGLPYVLLLSQFSAPVERVYVTNCQLSETGREKKARTYDYTVSVRFCLEKGDEMLAPEKTMDFHGTVVMKKKGWFRWLLDGVTLGE